MWIMGILNPIKIPKKTCRVRTPGIFPVYIYSHPFYGIVTFEHWINVTELQYKLGFIIYHVEDMIRYLRNLSRPYPCRIHTLQFVTNTKLLIMKVI